MTSYPAVLPTRTTESALSSQDPTVGSPKHRPCPFCGCEDPPFLTATEAGRRLGVSHNTIRKWADDGHLESWAVPGNGRVRFSRETIDRMASEGLPAVEADEDAAFLLSLSMAAQILGVSARTMGDLADGGHIEYRLTPGGHRRFTREAVERVRSWRRVAA